MMIEIKNYVIIFIWWTSSAGSWISVYRPHDGSVCSPYNIYIYVQEMQKNWHNLLIPDTVTVLYFWDIEFGGWECFFHVL